MKFLKTHLDILVAVLLMGSFLSVLMVTVVRWALYQN